MATIIPADMVIIEMSKLNAYLEMPAENISWLEAWSIFLNSANKPECREFINNLINTKEEVRMATELLMEISQDERQRAIMRSRKMYETDRISALLTAEDNGKIKGKIEGALEERRKNVQRMFQANFNIETIAKVLDIPEQDVKDILDSKAG